MKRRRYAPLILLACALFVAAVCGRAAEDAGVKVATMKDWAIVLDSAAIPAEKTAATILQDHMEKVFGKRPDVLTGSLAVTAKQCIVVGNGPAAKKLLPAFDPEEAGTDEIRILMRGETAVVTGGRPRGTLYAAYAFLEACFGIRFLTPEHTHIPPDAAERVIEPLDLSYNPPLGYRFVGYGVNCQNVAYTTRLRMNSNFARVPEELGGVTGQTLINHSLHGWLPYGKYGKEHPEYYCEIDGKRKTLDPNGPHEVYQLQPCMTNEEVYRIVLAGVREELKKNPNGTVSVSQYDSMACCRCEKCAAIDKREESNMGSLLTFVNRIAEEIEEEYPDARIGTLAYYYSRKPPKHLKPRKNVIIQLCNIESCLMHAVDDPDCPLNVSFQKDTDGWGAICDNIQVWTYGVNFRAFHLPAPNLFVLDKNIRYFVANNARGIFMDYSSYGEFAPIRNYIVGHLLWDPSRSGEALLEEFVRLHYRQSAPAVREIIDRVHDAAKDKHHACFGMAGQYGYSHAFGKELIGLFAKAMKEAEDETIRARLERLSLLAWRIRIDPVMGYVFWRMRGKDVPAPSAKLYAELRPDVDTYFALCEKYGETRLGLGWKDIDQVRAFIEKEDAARAAETP